MKEYRVVDIEVISSGYHVNTVSSGANISTFKIYLKSLNNDEIITMSVSEVLAIYSKVLGCFMNQRQNWHISVINKALWNMLDIVDIVQSTLPVEGTQIHNYSTNFGKYQEFDNYILFTMKRGITFHDIAFTSASEVFTIFDFFQKLLAFFNDSICNLKPVYLVIVNRVPLQFKYDKRMLTLYTKSRVLK